MTLAIRLAACLQRAAPGVMGFMATITAIFNLPSKAVIA
jgi:hypothetical protein